ncbi:MAG: serine/threonine-protein kinase [Planctomycetota bacterium]
MRVPSQRIQSLFEELCELPEPNRRLRLDRCENLDEQLQVRRLLDLYDDTGTSFEEGLQLELGSCAAMELPERVGPYRVQSVLGSGGMGVVYLAQQSEPQRQVAVKVLNRGLLSEASRRRFRREAELLGRLQHSGIAQVLEFGQTDDGSSYLAMEYVDGRPITEAARELDLHGRVDLLRQLAAAVHHAHLRGVVHRDLKPANVLVGDEGRVRVIDFGVARATEQELQTLATAAGEIIGTLAYMSPEQARGEVDAVDARADVYAMGVIAFELFSGQLPLPISSAQMADAIRIITQVDPPRLGSLAADCRGDVERIVGKALEKEPRRRYDSAAAFADDLERFELHQPIEARPPTALYQLTKVARRHRGATVASALTLLALVAGTGVSTYYAVRNADLARSEADAREEAVEAAATAREQAELAERNAEQAEANASKARESQFEAEAIMNRQLKITQFQARQIQRVDLRRMGETIQDSVVGNARARISAADPGAWSSEEAERFEVLVASLNPIDLARETLHSSILATTREAIAIEFANSPIEHAEMLDSHAALLLELGFYEDYLQVNQEALALLESELDAEHPHVVGKLVHLIAAYDVVGDDERVRELIATVDGLVDQAYGPSSDFALTFLSLKGGLFVRAGDFVAAEEVLRERVTRVEEAGLPAEVTVRSLGDLAVPVIQLGRMEEAEALLQRAVDLASGTPPPTILQKLGVCFLRQGRIEESSATLEQAVAGYTQAFGDTHPETLQVKENLASAYANAGRYEEAVVLLSETLELRLERPPSETQSTAYVEIFLGDLLLELGRVEEALVQMRSAADRTLARLGEGHQMTARARSALERAQAASSAQGEPLGEQ